MDYGIDDTLVSSVWEEVAFALIDFGLRRNLSTKPPGSRRNASTLLKTAARRANRQRKLMLTPGYNNYR